MTPAIFGCSGPELTADERDFFRDADPAGYILFQRNCVDADQLRRLTDALREIHGRERLLVSIDQEGGRVARLGPPEWHRWPAPARFGELYARAPASAIEALRLNSKAMATELAAAGISVDFHAPFDVARPETDDVIGDRALGSDPMQVAALGRAILDGMAAGGVVGCLKHMPGHGRATADSHKELPRVEAPDTELAVDIAPFQTLAQRASIGMTAHIVFTEWDAERPATQSAWVVENIIRHRIGFDGLLLSDDIDMQALDGSIPERSVRALEAGCDIVLNCWAKMDDMVGIAEACSPIRTESAARLDEALASVTRPSETAVIEDLCAQRDALFAAAGLSL
ncbi:beta-N-acetylhexosaminidase [Alteriqipengyuania lutimaris]|uniref:beta-N-acetylhexosaminidase n=1 Tax=Alteriqipengyuania lutimaris TaxID=1538146 RepID=A0A395LL37_9SPHN|nr:beta-N-acetylhexosaminidase [Alteriqipengyuania lutimaris]MBB3033432.1 beta-N-acetylhexosaminidase [Alteriqipengyuania lutimaris]RDS77551.1 beta-N-acetylhexosaminidase [Alteriqipengyuania lutimaris]